MRPIRMAGMGISNGLHSEEHDWTKSCEEWPQWCREATHVGSRGEIAVGYDPPPTHYDGGNGLDVWAIWQAYKLDAWEGALVKYILRSGKKVGESKLKDLKKARNYLAYLIEREERRDGA